MKVTPHEKATCKRKKPYGREGIARVRGQQRIQYGGDDCPERLWPYRCLVCGAWHLTSQFQPAVAPITLRFAFDFWQTRGVAA